MYKKNKISKLLHLKDITLDIQMILAASSRLYLKPIHSGLNVSLEWNRTAVCIGSLIMQYNNAENTVT